MVYPVEARTGPNRSTLYVPQGRGRAPGLLILHGSEGGMAGWTHVVALWFASLGFVTWPLSYSKGGNPWHAGDIVDVDLDRTEEALRTLRSHETVSGAVGLMGGSRGAEHALLLVSLMARDGSPDLPRAVAAHSSSDTIAGAFISGVYNPKQRETWDPSKRAWRWRGSSDDLKPTTPIEIERYAGPLYLSHGEADSVWTVECTRRLEARLRAAGREPEVYYYPGEDHGLRPETSNLQRTRMAAFFRRHLESG
ncbi:MAG: prolyl oligopeptidase family serine peptidase [Acetobacteraceae bacterium]|nr:prolyl oligopeptidase family serine peptidase [Acetobacteraceae bacterium]